MLRILTIITMKSKQMSDSMKSSQESADYLPKEACMMQKIEMNSTNTHATVAVAHYTASAGRYEVLTPLLIDRHIP